MSDYSLDSGLRVLLIDDHPLRRRSVRSFLETLSATRRGHLKIVEVATPERISGDVGAVDVGLLAATDMRAALARLAELGECLPGTPIVVLAEGEQHADVAAAMGAGAHGYISTRSDPELMLHALEFVAAGGQVFPPEALLQVSPGFDARCGRRSCNGLAGTEAETGGEGLTARQLEVLRLLRQGRPNKVIARDLGLREATVKVHVRQIMRRLGVANRTQAALVAAAEHATGL